MTFPKWFPYAIGAIVALAAISYWTGIYGLGQ
jgi:hypothetical protein